MLQPLADDIVAKYRALLPSLVHPVRVGEHTTTAFGLIIAYDYAKNLCVRRGNMILKNRGSIWLS